MPPPVTRTARLPPVRSTATEFSPPSVLEWTKETSTLGFRSSELKAVDNFLERFQNSIGAYGKDFYANEVRIAFDHWKKAEGPKWIESARNKSGMIARMDREIQVRFAGRQPPQRDAEVAENLRLGVLFFLSKVRVASMPRGLDEMINSAVDTGNDIAALVRTSRSQGAGGVAGAIKGGLQGQKGADSNDGFLKELALQIKGYLGSLPGAMTEYGQQALNFIIGHLSEMLKAVLGGILQNLTTVVAIAGGLKKAGTAAIATISSRNLEEGVDSGSPRQIVTSVRDQIKDYGYSGVKDAILAALLASLGAANPIAGTVCSAIASVYQFVTTIYVQFKDRLKMAALIKRAGDEMRKPAASRLSTMPDEFHAWFLDAIKDLPILSAYCMSMPMTGSYFGFLTLAATDGTEMASSQLERSYATFNDVKVWARKFVTSDPMKISTDDKIVSISLAAAREESSSQTMKTLKSRLKSTLFSVVETAAA